jgi:hypothetical protein
METATTPYDAEFYDRQVQGSLKSAEQMLGLVRAIFKPRSVVDVGCGRGAWLKVWLQLGAARAVGLDGAWVSGKDLLAPEIEFQGVDLSQPFGLPERFDLAMSLEVAEHCKPEASEDFVQSLTALSDAVMFGAAYTGQPGTDHINTRPHSFWCEQFVGAGYAAFDFFRPKVWGKKGIEPWYQQNTFLYVKPVSRLFHALLRAGERPMENLAFVDAVHPWLYDRSRRKKGG